MKKHIKYIAAIVMYCIYAEASHSQLTFSIDTLKISDVFWLSERNVWIEDFAYGPCFKMLFSIKNNGNSTVKIRTDDFNLHIEYGKAMKKKKEPVLDFQKADSVLFIPPDSTVVFRGQVFFWDMKGEITTEMNYRFVNFLPDITRVVENAKAIIVIPGFEIMKASFKNCYMEKTLFHDGTFYESIYHYRN